MAKGIRTRRKVSINKASGPGEGWKRPGGIFGLPLLGFAARVGGEKARLSREPLQEHLRKADTKATDQRLAPSIEPRSRRI